MNILLFLIENLITKYINNWELYITQLSQLNPKSICQGNTLGQSLKVGAIFTLSKKFVSHASLIYFFCSFNFKNWYFLQNGNYTNLSLYQLIPVVIKKKVKKKRPKKNINIVCLNTVYKMNSH